MLVLSGLDQNQAEAFANEVGGDHPRACTAWLTGAHARMTSGADLKAGISVDQVAAREFGKYTQLASLEVGLESAEIVGACESAYSCAYYNTISWRNDTTPMPMEIARGRSSSACSAIRHYRSKTSARREENRSTLDAVAEDVTPARAAWRTIAKDRPVPGAVRRAITRQARAPALPELRSRSASAAFTDHYGR
jgi:hypothetical protein